MPGIHKPGECVEFWDDQLDQNQEAFATDCRPDYKRILETLRPRAGETLLDVGCGNGQLLSAAVAMGLKSIGIEDTPEAAAISQKNVPEAIVVVGSEVELPFENNQFDLVTALDFLDYFPDPEEGLEEIHRVLKLGGRSCLLLPNSEFIGNNKYFQSASALESPAVAFSLKVWKRMIETAGLKIVSVYPNLPQARKSPCQPNLHIQLTRFFIRLFWRLLPLKWSYQFVCYCYKD